jgi:prefoldin subunit 5
MSFDTNKLTSMAKAAPSQVEAINTSISSVEDSISDLTKQKNAIENGVCGSAKTQATDIIENIILVDKGGDHVSYGPTFGVIQWAPSGNLTDWVILDATNVPIYSYVSGDYPDLDELVDDYDFGNDYLTRPLISGATYGLEDSISSLQNASNLLNENMNKIADSQAIFEKYGT